MIDGGNLNNLYDCMREILSETHQTDEKKIDPLSFPIGLLALLTSFQIDVFHLYTFNVKCWLILYFF